MMRRMWYLFLIGFMLTSFDAFAGIYGGIKGRVLDEGGEPLVGANVFVVGTNLGAYTDAEGRYSIQKINPGNYNIKFSYAGYKEKIMPVDVELDIVKDIGDIRLGGSVTDTIEVRVQMIQKQNIGSISSTNTKDVRKLPVNGINGIVALTSGVRGTGGGFSVRGARTSETQIRMDGLDIGNQFTGGFGIAGSGLFPMVSQYATEQVQVIKGGFSAEYGDVLGGVVNTTVKTGRTDKYEGFLVYNGELDALWGRQKAGLKLIRESEGSRLKAIDYGEGYKLIGSEGLDFEGGFGGPLPFIENSSFYVSGTYKFNKYSSGYDINDPWGNSIVHLPNDNTWVKNLTARVRFALTKDINFIVGGTFGMTNFEQMDWGWLYCDDEGVLDYRVKDDNTLEILKTNGIPEYEAKNPVGNQNNSSIMVRMNHSLSQTSYYELTFSRNTNDDEYGRRIGNSDPGFFSGFDYWYPTDNKQIQGYNLIAGKDKIIDPYTYLSRVGKTKDKYFLIDMGFINPETGYIEGEVDGNGSDNPYGRTGAFVVHGNSGFQFRDGTYWQIDGNYNLLLPYKDKSKDFDHAIRAGFEVRFYETTKHSNSNPWDGDPFYDVFSDQWGGNIYISDYGVAYDRTSKGFFPVRASAYVQDQISYKGIIFSPGIRVDMFDPKSVYRINADQTFTGVDQDSGFADASAKFQVSPRINIAYPITDRSFLSIAYGIYFKMPEIQYLYDGFNKIKLRGGSELLGEPNMEAQRTNQYQISYNHQISDLFAFDITAYYRDIYNQLGTKYVAITPYPYYQYVIAEYGNAKGIEFQIRKRDDLKTGDPISFRVDYTLGYITGTSANVASNYGKPIDPYTNEMTFQMTEYFQPQDIRHTLNASITYSFGRNQGPAIGDVYPLEMTYLTLSGFFRSGSPYTPLDGSGNAVGEVNSERQPSAYNLSLRFSKTFLISDFIDGAGNTSFEVFFDVYNVLNLNDAIAFFPRTNDPIDNGSAFDYRIGYFSAVPYYRDPNYLIAETISPEQYNRYGDRLYSADADLDYNGMVTQDEKLRAYERQIETSLSGRGNFQSPRTVYFGLMVNF